jgi:hypothetical protein
MKNLTTQILILIFLFLFPPVSFSQTFKCEFIQEKFKGGKTNKITCSGKLEELWSSNKRNEHCRVGGTGGTGFEDYIDYTVDLKNKSITYKEKSGTTPYGIDEMVLYHKGEGDNTSEDEIRKRYGEVHTYNMKREIVSIKTFSQIDQRLGGDSKKRETTSHLITYKWISRSRDFEGKGIQNDLFSTLYIPENGESVISGYVMNTGRSSVSSVNLRFGKCVNTSN